MNEKLKEANAKISEYQNNYQQLLQKYTGLKRQNMMDKKKLDIPSKNVSLINSPLSNNSRISSNDLDISSTYITPPNQ